MALYALIGWTHDGAHHFSLWTTKEKAEEHAPKIILHPELADCELEWTEVVEVGELDTGRNLAWAAMGIEDDEDET